LGFRNIYIIFTLKYDIAEEYGTFSIKFEKEFKPLASTEEEPFTSPHPPPSP